MNSQRFQFRLAIIVCIVALLLPIAFKTFGISDTWIYDLCRLLPYGILALALNVVVGYVGMLHLGIMAFFAVGAYVTGIAVQPVQYPFHVGLFTSAILAMLLTALVGILVGAPTLRLRGDYLALVTLGFGEMIKDTIVNMEEITQGIQTITPIGLEEHSPDWLSALCKADSLGLNNTMYYVCIFFLIVTYLLLRNVERSRLGRAFIAMREDELAATCMGMNSTKVRLSAFVISAAIAGLGGCLFTFVNNGTTDPKNTFDFSHSVIVLACVILGGMGNRLGVLLGVFLVLGFDTIAAPKFDNFLQSHNITGFAMRDWRILIYGLALVIMMRFRPEGILPEQRLAHELHPEE